jgi:hypothetical protein
VALVAVEHQAFILYNKVYLKTPALSSLDVAKTEMTKADFTPDTVDEISMPFRLCAMLAQSLADQVPILVDSNNINGASLSSFSFPLFDESRLQGVLDIGRLHRHCDPCGAWRVQIHAKGMSDDVDIALPMQAKVLNAQAASALAIIVYGNLNDDTLVIMSGLPVALALYIVLPRTADPGVTADIAAFYIGYSAGVLLKNYLLSNPGLTCMMCSLGLIICSWCEDHTCPRDEAV